MISAGNQQALEDARLSFILGARIPPKLRVVVATFVQQAANGPTERLSQLLQQAGVRPALTGLDA